MTQKNKGLWGETIAAVSTPPGTGAIGIVRMSGDRTTEILEEVVPSCRGKLEPKKAHIGWVRDPRDGKRIDEVVVLFFKGPRSFTGEDVGELHGHGGRKNLERILEVVLEKGARVAKPGEFSKRGFLNGRMDLSKAESIARLIEAKTKRACEIAVNQMGGMLGKRIQKAGERLNQVMVELEARVDFPEEELDLIQEAGVEEVLREVGKDLERLVKSYEYGSMVGEETTVGIVGKANVGKSCLLNRILGKKRALVDERPGTTRDFVEGCLPMGGGVVRFVDTAGWRESSEKLEIEGKELAKEELKTARLIIVVQDATRGQGEEDREVWEEFKEKEKIPVWNKMDLIEDREEEKWKGMWGERSRTVSAKEGWGVEDLLEEVEERVFGGLEGAEEDLVVTERRHVERLKKALECLKRARKRMDEGAPEEIVIIDIRQAKKEMEKIVGRRVGRDVLGAIFERFCIGK